jgi:hypothetical protein
MANRKRTKQTMIPKTLHLKEKTQQYESHARNWDEIRCSRNVSSHVPPVASVVLLFNDKNFIWYGNSVGHHEALIKTHK